LLKDLFDRVLNEYRNTTQQAISRDDPMKSLVEAEIPREIERILGLDGDHQFSKGSIGKGNRTLFPWVSVFDHRLSQSAQEGIYVVYLFRKDMSGFYLTLSQGITYFTENYPKKPLALARHTADAIRSMHWMPTHPFSSNPIQLISESYPRGKGYEASNIVSKYYARGTFDNQTIISDLRDMMNLYLSVCDSINKDTYLGLIEDTGYNFYEGLIPSDRAIQQIHHEILELSGQNEIETTTLTYVDVPPRSGARTVEISRQVHRKIDYIKKDSEDAKTGHLGESLVIEYEQNRLRELGRNDLAEQVKWVSEVSDTFGFDILSFDILDNSDVSQRYIEVKTTELGIDTPFFVSANELQTSARLADNYWVYRVFRIDTHTQGLYSVKGPIQEAFSLFPKVYVAKR